MKLISVPLLGLAVPLCASAELVELTSADGRNTIRAEIAGIDRAGVDLVLEGGREMNDVALSYFDAATVQRLRAFYEAGEIGGGTAEAGGRPRPDPNAPLRGANRDVEFTAVNEAFGLDIFQRGSIWGEDPKAVARRMRLGEESDTPFTSSFRSYFRQGIEVLDATCWSASLYATRGEIDRIALIFANKGDNFSAAGGGQAHFDRNGGPSAEQIEEFEEEMESEHQKIRAALTAVLGEPVKQRFGDGEARTGVERWDWLDHAFLLVLHEGQMLEMLMVPSAIADPPLSGKVAKEQDAELEARIGDCVTERSNGDHVIENIPMVDQGPKGYCVPATMERVMRFMGVPADMYELAVLGSSGYGGGTSVEMLLEATRRDVRHAGRKFEEAKDEELDIETIAEQVDRGVPVLWRLSSTNQYNSVSNEITAARPREAGDEWDEWVAKMNPEGEGRSPEVREDHESNFHVVLIIGYNEASSEIATTDSWGPEYSERWIPLNDARQVSNGALLWIEP